MFTLEKGSSESFHAMERQLCIAGIKRTFLDTADLNLPSLRSRARKKWTYSVALAFKVFNSSLKRQTVCPRDIELV